MSLVSSWSVYCLRVFEAPLLEKTEEDFSENVKSLRNGYEERKSETEKGLKKRFMGIYRKKMLKRFRMVMMLVGHVAISDGNDKEVEVEKKP